MDSLLVNFCLLYVGKHWQCQNTRPCEIDTSTIALVYQQIEAQEQFILTDYSHHSFLADTDSSAHPRLDRIIL